MDATRPVLTPPNFAEQLSAMGGGPTPGEQSALAERNEARADAVPAPSTWARKIPTAQLIESSTNPRRRWKHLDELGESILTAGVLEALVVRPLPPGSTAGREQTGVEWFEIICGARRFRAGKAVGLTEFPCDVRQVSDDHVREFQIIENIQREGLHPMEEAEGYEALMETGYTVEVLAKRVGKSTGWIYLRLQLLKLGPEARGAYFDDKFHVSVAQVLGRQTHASQAAALPRLEQLATAREQIEFLQNEHAKNLKGAPFDLKDGTLPRLGQTPGFGDCHGCPKNSNNAPRELFVDYSKIERVGVCSDVECFAGKCATVVERQAEKARGRGEKVLTAAETKRVISYGAPVSGSPYVNSLDVLSDDPKRRTWAQLLEKLPAGERPEVVLAPNDQKPGEMFRLYERKAAISAAAKVGASWAKKQEPEEKMVERSKKKRREADDKARLVAEVTRLAMPKLIKRWRDKTALPELRALANASLDSLGAGELAVEVLEWFGVRTPGFAVKGAEKALEGFSGRDLLAFVLVSTLFPRWDEEQAGVGEFDAEFSAFAKGAGVDLKAMIRAQLEASRAAEAQEKRASQVAIIWTKGEVGTTGAGGLEGKGPQGRAYSVSYNGGGYFAKWHTKKSKGGEAVKTVEAGRARCEEIEASFHPVAAAKAVRS
jgi:ParB/RepB/Spo0J family partition protein